MRIYVIALTLLASSPALAELAALPLSLGYYVEAGQNCAEGNDANLAYLHASGVNNRYGMCSFDSLTQQDAGLWSFAATCQDGEEGAEFLNEGRITIKSTTSFHIYDGTQDLSYEFCPNDSLSPQFR